MVPGQASVFARMASTHIVNGQHARPLATLHDCDARVGADAVVIEEPLNVDGQVAAGDEASDRNGVFDVCGLIAKVKGRDFGRDFKE